MVLGFETTKLKFLRTPQKVVNDDQSQKLV